MGWSYGCTRWFYRGDDHGRWLPGVKPEFLVRRDAQVKIRGFRVEIGEIENALLRVPGLRGGVVLAAEWADQGKHLVAFYSGERPVEADVLRNRLGASRPKYMVLLAFHWRDDLPLTANSEEVAYETGLVHDAVALGLADEALGHQIVLVVTPSNSAGFDPAAVTARLRQVLPGYMVSAEAVVRSVLPRSPNGKFDRASLRQELTASRPQEPA